MSTTLNFVESLFDRATTYFRVGDRPRAKALFERLASLRHLPPEIAEEIQSSLAELCRDDDEPYRERQHLAAAIAQRPLRADYSFRMAQAILRDDDADDEKAIPYLREALRLDPENPEYLAELGSLLARLDSPEKGLRLLLAAQRIAEHDVEILERLADALVEADRSAEARNMLRTAMFRHSGDRRFRDLYRDFQFRALAKRQADTQETPAILPFVRDGLKPRRVNIDGQIVRIDGAEPLAGPSRRSPSRKKHSS